MDSETNAEFIRFLQYAKRSCIEVQSVLYVALDEEYILASEFKVVSEQAKRIRHDRLPFADSSTISRNLPAIRQAGIKWAK